MKKGIFILASACGVFSITGFLSLRVFAITVTPNTTDTFVAPTITPSAPTTPTVVPGVVTPTPTKDDLVPIIFIPPPSGSTQVKPPGSTGNPLQTRYPGITIPSPSISSEYYSKLPACPTPPICLSINGDKPAGYISTPPTSCPDSCTVTRSITYNTVGTGPGAIQQIASTTAAVCPAGYTGVGTYNAGQEIKFQASPQPAPYPIDPVNYAIYKQAGYSCALVATGKYIQFCAVNVSYPLNTDTQIAGYQGQYTYLDSQCVSIVDCSLGATCSGALGVTHNRRYKYYYSYYKCTPPNGLFFTTAMIPTSIVCARVKPTWVPSNVPPPPPLVAPPPSTSGASM